MRLLVTADLHFNHRLSRPPAERVIDQMNAAGGDVLLVVGDTAAGDGDELEQCLARFRFPGPKLFVAGNHELWTRREDSYALFREELPARIRSLGWHWLESDPFVAGGVAIVGSVGWYDYSFAPESLGIPRRFYEQKLTPAAAERFGEYAPLLERTDDIPPSAREILARWNDGRHVKLGRTDPAFLDELLAQLGAHLAASRACRKVVAAVHHVPFPELLPPSRGGQWDFARAYLGSPRLGELLLRADNLSHVFCGHSHFPVEARIGNVRTINIGSGYRQKKFCQLEID